MVHMLERARKVHKINKGETGRNSVVKCPFCIADEDEAWFKTKNFGFEPPEKRPKNPIAPHCVNCPLVNDMHQVVGSHPNHVKNVQGLMDDCVPIGRYLLGVIWEESDV
jgi:hypothetical protein